MQYYLKRRCLCKKNIDNKQLTEKTELTSSSNHYAIIFARHSWLKSCSSYPQQQLLRPVYCEAKYTASENGLLCNSTSTRELPSTSGVRRQHPPLSASGTAVSPLRLSRSHYLPVRLKRPDQRSSQRHMKGFGPGLQIPARPENCWVTVAVEGYNFCSSMQGRRIRKWSSEERDGMKEMTVCVYVLYGLAEERSMSSVCAAAHTVISRDSYKRCVGVR